ncbi:RNA polymerase sigma factor [Sanyastnella coralliicola]|uniref:RNA polymerase sigma factor n=1 Tax=Sanyastnella coralliicola TaxID=3069118 RepID=UPI0027B9839D|nr:sigma-70 family RNA polymerase sigma factor [Longitalea sp. SCSIO 12813]
MLKRKKRKLSDEEIVKIVVEEKSHDDFGILYDRYAEKVYHKCISFVKDTDLAQDLAHDIFIKTFVNLSRFTHKSRFSTWLYSLTYNFCIDYLRKNNKVRYESDDQLVNIPNDEDDRNEKELLSLKASRLASVLDLISPDDKAILLMKYQDDMSVKDLEAALEISESAVKMRVKRARAKAVETYRKTYTDE